MSGTTGDVLTQARTPTPGESTVLRELWEDGVGPNDMAQSLLHRAAPRILALAYREAARQCEAVLPYCGKEEFDAVWNCTDRLHGLATALEEGNACMSDNGSGDTAQALARARLRAVPGCGTGEHARNTRHSRAAWWPHCDDCCDLLMRALGVK